MNIPPVIKWSGSKRSQADKIVERMPDKIKTYYEPFCGGASVFIKLATSNKKVKNFVLSDLNADLINLWKEIKGSPEKVYDEYHKTWSGMKSKKTWDQKSKYYYDVRERLNAEKSPFDFMFIMRTSFNGMSRYNRKGDFNAPFHPNRDGILPEKLKEIIYFWSKVLNDNKVDFYCRSYEEIEKTVGEDFIYLDPPYAGIVGLYYGSLADYENLWNFLRKQKADWMLSFDGKTTSTDYTVEIPKDLYLNHEFLNSGNSSFRRLNKKSNSEIVFESLYSNYKYGEK